MVDDVLIFKAATMERSVARARDEYAKNPDTFATDYTRQDAAILNIQRACQAALDMGQHLIRRECLGISQGSQDVFERLLRGDWISKSLADSLKAMVGFRNIAVHDYQAIQLAVTVAIITQHLDELLNFSQVILQREGK